MGLYAREFPISDESGICSYPPNRHLIRRNAGVIEGLQTRNAGLPLPSQHDAEEIAPVSIAERLRLLCPVNLRAEMRCADEEMPAGLYIVLQLFVDLFRHRIPAEEDEAGVFLQHVDRGFDGHRIVKAVWWISVEICITLD